ncbi:MAG: hypothetical protein R2728_09795 [Chitinophagales bacterium]
MKINIRAAFLSFKFIPRPFTIGYNNINPKLIFHDDEIEFRNVFTTNKLRYDAIESVDIYTIFKTNNIILKPKNSILTHSFNVKDKSQFQLALQFLSDKNCPLSEKALKAIAN